MGLSDDLKRQITRARRALARWAMRWAYPLESVPQGVMLESDNPRGIRDGAWYDLPVMLPGYMRRNMDADQIATYLTEVDARTTMRFQFDAPNRSAWDMAIPPAADDPLCEWNRATREQVLSNCHAAYQRHPLAKAAVDYTVGFVVGDGYNVTYHNKDVEALLEQFQENSDTRRLEKDWLRDLQVDGEIVARLEGAGADLMVLPLRPWELDEIETENGRPVTFCFTFRDEDGGMPQEREEIDAADMLFVPINKHAYELRGRPELFVVLPWLRAWREWLEDRARQNYWRGALLWWVKVITTSASALSSIMTRWKKPPTPGSVYVGSDKEEINAVNNPIGAGDAGEDGRQMKLAIAAGLRLPEYFFADGANANLASSTSQELPALTKFSDFQQIMVRRVWVPLFKRVIEAALESNKLAPVLPMHDSDGEVMLGFDGQPRTIEAVKAFDVAYEPLSSSDPVNVAQAITLDLKNGIVSRQTASAERGYDYQKEQRLMSMEEQAIANDVRQGVVPPPPTMRPEALPPEPGDNGQTAQPGDDTPEELDQMQRDMQQARNAQPATGGY